MRFRTYICALLAFTCIGAVSSQAAEPRLLVINTRALAQDLTRLDSPVAEALEALQPEEPNYTLEYLIVDNGTGEGTEYACAVIEPGAPALAGFGRRKDRTSTFLEHVTVNDPNDLIRETLLSLSARFSPSTVNDAYLLTPRDLHSLSNLLKLNSGLWREPFTDKLASFAGLMQEPLYRWVFQSQGSSHALLLTGFQTSSVTTAQALPCSGSTSSADFMILSPEQSWLEEAIKTLHAETVPVNFLFDVRSATSDIERPVPLGLFEIHVITTSGRRQVSVIGGEYVGGGYLVTGMAPREVLFDPDMEFISRHSSLRFIDAHHSILWEAVRVHPFQPEAAPVMAFAPSWPATTVELDHHEIKITLFPPMLTSVFRADGRYNYNASEMRDLIEQIPARLQNKITKGAGTNTVYLSSQMTALVSQLDDVTNYLSVGFEDSARGEIIITISAVGQGVPRNRLDPRGLGIFVRKYLERRFSSRQGWHVVQNVRIHPPLQPDSGAIIKVEFREVPPLPTDDLE